MYTYVYSPRKQKIMQQKNTIIDILTMEVLKRVFSLAAMEVLKRVFSLAAILEKKKGGSLEFETTITLQLLVRFLQMRA